MEPLKIVPNEEATDGLSVEQATKAQLDKLAAKVFKESDIKALFKEYEEPPASLIPGVLPERQGIVFLGEPSSCKTLLAIYFLLMKAAGLPLLGRVDPPMEVALFGLEADRGMYQSWIRRLMGGIGLKEIPPTFHLITETDVDLAKMQPGLLAFTCASRGYALILIDDFRSLSSASTSYDNEITPVMKELAKVLNKGTQYIMTMHPNKGHNDVAGAYAVKGRLGGVHQVAKGNVTPTIKTAILTCTRSRGGLSEGNTVSFTLTFDDTPGAYGAITVGHDTVMANPQVAASGLQYSPAPIEGPSPEIVQKARQDMRRFRVWNRQDLMDTLKIGRPKAQEIIVVLLKNGWAQPVSGGRSPEYVIEGDANHPTS